MTEVLDDPFAVETNEDDPFATADETKGGNGGPFVPWPGIEAVAERLVVLVPRSFDPEAKVSEFLQRTYNLPATREEWRVDLIVLDGGEMRYTYRAKVEGSEPAQYEEKEHVVSEADLPYLIPGWRITWGNIIGVLNRTSKGPRPFALGRIKAGYSIKEMRAGKTFEQFAAEREAYYASPRGKKEPRPVWHFVATEDAADRDLALAWWKQAKANGFSAQ